MRKPVPRPSRPTRSDTLACLVSVSRETSETHTRGDCGPPAIFLPCFKRPKSGICLPDCPKPHTFSQSHGHAYASSGVLHYCT